jgi:thiamine pyrophosphokinase
MPTMFYNLQDNNFLIRNHRSIICLNGDLPEKAFFEDNNLPIIAADGAANRLFALRVKPNVIIGDLDSLAQTARTEAEQDSIPIILITEQDTTDFQKALQYAGNNNLHPSIVLGVNGGFLDHVLNNISIIIENNCIFYSPPIIGCVIRESIQLKLKETSKISLFGMSSAEVRTSGLKWNLSGEKLELPGFSSCLNRVAHEDVLIEVINGRVLLLIYETDEQDMGLV